MQSNTEILNAFGELIVREVFDNQYKFILNKADNLAQTDGYKNLFSGMNPVQKKEIEFYTQEFLKGAIFDFLQIFEDCKNFKIIYEEDDTQVNLHEISEMLKTEIINENGWVKKFSNQN
jgi:very-short-patch-repair endonuclease